MDDTWVDIPPPRPQPTGPSGICSCHVGPMLARGSQHRIAYLGQEAMDHRYADTKSVIAWGRLGITTKGVAVVCCEPKPCCSGLTSCERLTVVSANSSFQDSSGSKKPYLCRRGSSWYKQGRLGRPTMLIPPGQDAPAAHIGGCRAGVGQFHCAVCTQRGCSQHLCNMAAAWACECALQQMMKKSAQKCVIWKSAGRW